MTVFVDTSAWFALKDRRDENHRLAAAFLDALKSQSVLFVTTDYVVDETLTLLRYKLSHRDALSFLRLLDRSPQLFTRYRDKLWSLTDCVSFAYMESIGLKESFAFDENFSQFGLTTHPESQRGRI